MALARAIDVLSVRRFHIDARHYDRRARGGQRRRHLD